MPMTFNSFAEFYPVYLEQHSHPWCRYLHYLGLSLVLLLLPVFIINKAYVWILVLPIVGYGCSWIGHFVFEKNKPASFGHPFYSFLGDWVMYKDWLIYPFRK